MNYIIKNLFKTLQKNYVFFCNFRNIKINLNKKHNNKIYLSSILDIRTLNYFGVFKHLKKLFPLFLINSKNSLIFSFNDVTNLKKILSLKEHQNYNIYYISIYNRLITFSKFEKVLKNDNILLKNISIFIKYILYKNILYFNKILFPFFQIKKKND